MKRAHQQSDENDWKLYHALVDIFRMTPADPDAVRSSIVSSSTEAGIHFESVLDQLQMNAEVDLRNIHLSRLSIVFLAAALRLFPSVVSLTVGSQHLNSPLLLILLDGMEQSKIRSIDLSNNPIGSLGVQAVYQLVVRKPQFRSVKLDGVECVPSLFRKLQRVLDEREIKRV